MSAEATLQAPPPLADIPRAALFLDFDGTLVPIAPEPGQIDVPDNLAARLVRLAGTVEQALALVSGRAIDDLTQFVGSPPLYRAGSHGAHVIGPDGEIIRAADPIPSETKAALKDYASRHGLYFEDKPHGAGLHSRKVPEKFEAMAAFARQVAERHELACKTGKQVVELVQPGADKGGAVRLLMQQPEFAGRTPIFLGDDVTDEDGFAACADAGGFGIAVGERVSQGAKYRLDAVDEVYQWLGL